MMESCGLLSAVVEPFGTTCRYTARPSMQTAIPEPDNSDIGRRPYLQVGNVDYRGQMQSHAVP